MKYAVAGLGALPVLTTAACLTTSDSPSPAERSAMQQTALAVMREHAIPGLSMSIARHGKIVYEEALGFANRESGEKVAPSSLFRIASVSKPITSAAVFTLVELGRIDLENFVFGQNGVLGNDFGAPPFQRYVEEIKIKHLLTHTGGWSNESNDPMFLNPQMNHRQLIAWTLNNIPLTLPPGQRYAYSNFGYCLLGRVIEKVSGRPYERFVEDEVFNRCGISGMQIGGNTLAERIPQEVVYYAQGTENPYNMNVRRMDSHGGWLATASDLVRFAVHVDGQSPARNILKPATIQEMTAPTAAGPDYAKGWSVNKYNNWWHNGSLPGTSTIMVRTGSDFCWAALTNTREVGGDTAGAIDRMMWDAVRNVKNWKA